MTYAGAIGRQNWIEEWMFFGAEADYAPTVA